MNYSVNRTYPAGSAAFDIFINIRRFIAGCIIMIGNAYALALLALRVKAAHNILAGIFQNYQSSRSIVSKLNNTIGNDSKDACQQKRQYSIGNIMQCSLFCHMANLTE